MSSSNSDYSFYNNSHVKQDLLVTVNSETSAQTLMTLEAGSHFFAPYANKNVDICLLHKLRKGINV